MTQDERREYLIQYLLKEEIRLGRQNIPTDKQGQENLLRSLMNVRPQDQSVMIFENTG